MEEQSLRSFLQAIPEGDILRLKQANEDYLLTALVMELDKRQNYPVVWLEDPARRLTVVGNLFASRQRLAAAVGGTGDFPTRVLAALARVIKPLPVDRAPVQERVRQGVEVDLNLLPLVRHFEQDAGRYISSGIVVARDPRTGRYNLSFHRLQLKGRDRMGISLHSRGHLWQYFNHAEAAGRDLEIAVIIGAHPALYLAAATKIPDSVDDYEVAGSLLGSPVRLVRGVATGLEVPAEAEYILEGKILAGVREPEGPFGEYTGYATSRSTNNIFAVTAITSRQEPVFLELIPGFSTEHILLSQATKEVSLLQKLKEQIPGVRALNLPKNGCHFHAYLSLEQAARGQARQALMLLFGLDPYIKLAVAVDADIDVYNEEEVMWALATRMQADEDVFIVPRVFCNRLDPSARDGMAAKLGIDATRSPDWEVKPLSLPEAAMAKAKSILL
ncbi:MAG: hypothetical protein PWQ18_12 [Clostridia bacterium]|nr:hypothetical protein [Clostridia bacterium]